MDELTAKKDQSLFGWDVRYLVPFSPELELEPNLKSGQISANWSWISGTSLKICF